MKKWQIVVLVIAVAVLAAGMFMSMSKADMLEYWRRIFSEGFVPGMAISQQQPPSAK